MRLMLKAFKTALRTNRAQEAFFETCAAHSRFVYNKFLEYKKLTYEARGYLEDIGVPDAKLYTKMPTQLGSSKWLTALKSRNPWLYESRSHVCVGAMADCDKAFKNFFEGLKSGRHVGYPKFKSKHKTVPSFYVHNQTVKIFNDSVQLAKIGRVKLFEKGYLPVTGKISFGTISKYNGRWHISVIVEVPEPQVVGNTGGAIGIDFGLSTWMTLSNGRKIDNPRHYREAEAELARLNRRFARAKLGSGRRERLKLKLQKYHAWIAAQRQDACNKATTALTKEFSSITVENLNIKGLMKTRLSKSFGDAALGEAKRQLQYKGSWYGCEIKEADRFFASSKICNNCATKNEELSLSDREWVCKNCGVTHDRDLNAAKNLADYFGRFDDDNQATGSLKPAKVLKSKPKRPEAGLSSDIRGLETSGVLENSVLSPGDET